MVNITFFGDIAGRVALNSHNADRVTVGSVCLPSGALTSIRKRVPVAFPKWRNASDENVDLALDIILNEAMAVSASSIDTRTAKWQQFWQDASDVHSKTASYSGGSISFIKAANQIKYLLFNTSISIAGAHAIKIGTIPRILNRQGILKIRQNIVLDNDIQGDENIDALISIWNAANSHQPRINSLGIEIKTEPLQLKTEQSEPLLLLPDYVAGIFQSANSGFNTLSNSKISPSAAKYAHEKLMKSNIFHEFADQMTMSFTDIFPEFSVYLG